MERVGDGCRGRGWGVGTGEENMKIHVIHSDHSVINLYNGTCMYTLSTGPGAWNLM
jgi:hypothetical protein